MFAALFGGVTVEFSSEKSLTDKSLMVNMMSPEASDMDASGEQLNNDLMALIASVQIGRGLEQKVAGCQGDIPDDDPQFEQALILPDDENSDALALTTSGALFPETQGGEGVLPRFSVTGRTNMAFEDEVSSNGRAGDTATGNNLARADGLLQKSARLDGINLLEQSKVSSNFIGPQTLQQNSAKISENLAADLGKMSTKNMAADMANLRALRASNLEQQNADIDAETAKGDFDRLNGNLGKNDLTGAGLKQMMASAVIPKFASKVVSRLEGGKTSNDVTRMAAASSSALDSGPLMSGTAANGSSTGQSGGQTGQQGGSQAGPQSGSGLLNNLNNLQMLDTAKDNWTEMLLQRVKNGLSGGKDQLDFQLNPRNLGKMRISLIMQNGRTNIQIQTETSAAASMLGDSEARLAQMLEASGLRLGNLNSGQFQGFGGAGSDQQANQQSQNKTGSLNQPDNSQDKGEVEAEIIASGSDNLINIQA